MTPAASVLLLGPDHPEPGAVMVGWLPDAPWAAATSAGHISPVSKLDGNEDSAGLARCASGAVLAVVADAHFGARAGTAAVTELVAQATASGAPHALMQQALLEARAQLEGEASTSAAALLTVVLEGTQLHWGSIGDCRGWVIRRDGSILSFALLTDHFLGSFTREEHLRFGTSEVRRDDRLVLASDGLPEAVYGIPTIFPEEIATVGGSGSPAEAAQALVERALARGGEDNVTVIVADVGHPEEVRPA